MSVASKRAAMRYLIDGYNLMHSLGLVRRSGGDRAWFAARQKMLDWLAEQLSPRTADTFQVVFDAQKSVGALENNQYRGVKILIARGQSADDVIEQMLPSEQQPKTLTVVSNDQRLRDAAWKNECHWIKCEAFTEAMLSTATKRNPTPNPPEKSEFYDATADSDLLKIFAQPKE